MKIITAFNDEEIIQYEKENGLYFENYTFEGHTCHRGEQVTNFINQYKNSNKFFIVYDTVALDYFDPNDLLFIDKNCTAFNFAEKFKDKLRYMYAGEIILNGM